MLEDNRVVPRAAGPGGLHKFGAGQPHDRGPHGSRVDRNGADGEGQDQIGGAGAEGRHNGDGQEDGGHRVQHVQRPHDDVFDSAAVVPGHRPQQSPHDQGRGCGQHTHHQGDPGAEDDAGEDAAPEVICAEGVL